MTEILLRQAKIWGFVCQSDEVGNIQILPRQQTERWNLQQVGDSWLLVVGHVPQVQCCPQQALEFLERRRGRAVSFSGIHVKEGRSNASMSASKLCGAT